MRGLTGSIPWPESQEGSGRLLPRTPRRRTPDVDIAVAVDSGLVSPFPNDMAAGHAGFSWVQLVQGSVVPGNLTPTFPQRVGGGVNEWSLGRTWALGAFSVGSLTSRLTVHAVRSPPA